VRIDQNIQVCNAPSYFATIWKYLKSWVDPNTAEKIVVLSSTEALPALEKHIDDVNIPTAFGGGFNYTHGMLPDLDDKIWQRFSWKLPSRSLPPGPIKWTEDVDGRIVALAVGGEGGTKRRTAIAILDPVDKQLGNHISLGQRAEKVEDMIS
jgi:hypothetical protein